MIQMVKSPTNIPQKNKNKNSCLIKTTAHSKKQTNTNSLQVLPVASQTRPVLQFPLFAPEQSPPLSSSVWKQKTRMQHGFSSRLADPLKHAHYPPPPPSPNPHSFSLRVCPSVCRFVCLSLFSFLCFFLSVSLSLTHPLSLSLLSTPPPSPAPNPPNLPTCCASEAFVSLIPCGYLSDKH